MRKSCHDGNSDGSSDPFQVAAHHCDALPAAILLRLLSPLQCEGPAILFRLLLIIALGPAILFRVPACGKRNQKTEYMIYAACLTVDLIQILTLILILILIPIPTRVPVPVV